MSPASVYMKLNILNPNQLIFVQEIHVKLGESFGFICTTDGWYEVKRHQHQHYDHHRPHNRRRRHHHFITLIVTFLIFL